MTDIDVKLTFFTIIHLFIYLIFQFQVKALAFKNSNIHYHYHHPSPLNAYLIFKITSLMSIFINNIWIKMILVINF